MSKKFLKVLNIVNNKLNPPEEEKVTDINDLVKGINIKNLNYSFLNLRGIKVDEKIGLCNVYNPKKNKSLLETLRPIINLNGFFVYNEKLYGYSDYLIFEVDFCLLKIKKVILQLDFVITFAIANKEKIILINNNNKIIIINNSFKKEKEHIVDYRVNAIAVHNDQIIVGGNGILEKYNSDFKKEKEQKIDSNISLSLCIYLNYNL